MRGPEDAHGNDDPVEQLGVPLACPDERRPDVRKLGLEPDLPPCPIGAAKLEARSLDQFGERPRVSVVQFGRICLRLEQLERVFTDRLEHQEPVAADRLEQAQVDECRKLVEVGAADLLGGLQREAADEDGETPEDGARLLVEQLMAPLDRGPQRALALRGVPRAAGEQGERVLEALEQALRIQELCAGGGELDGERKPVQAPADRSNAPAGLHLPPDRARPLDEELDRVRVGERLERVLALSRHSQRRTARNEQAQAGRAGKQLGKRRCGG